MKRLSLILAIVFSMTFYSCGQLKVFQDVAGIPGVETVTIGKAAMQIMKKSIHTGGDKYIPKDAIREMEGMEIITAGNANAIEAVRTVLTRVLQEGGYESLIESNGDGGSSSIYAILSQEDGEEGICHNMLIVSEEPWELNIVLIKGTFNMDKIVAGNMNRAVPN